MKTRRYTWSGGFIYDSVNPTTLARLQGPDQAENGKLICDALNACRGMTDPEREIAELREALIKANRKIAKFQDFQSKL